MEAGPRARPAAGPLRPLLVLALALGAGTWLGLHLRSGHALVDGLVVAGLAALPWALPRLGLARITLARGALARVPSWAGLLLALAWVRARETVDLPPRAAPASAADAQALGLEPIAGRWHAHGRDSGWIEPFRDRVEDRGAGLLFELEGAPGLPASAPEEGEGVLVLPGNEVVPWPRGPVPAPGSGGFAARARVAPDALVRLEERRASSPLARLVELRRALHAGLAGRVASLEGPAGRGLLQALGVGERAELAPERTDLFVRTGTYHLLSISGWHVGLFAACVLALVAPRRRRGGIARLAVVLALLAFAALAGGEKPVVRATVMLVLWSLAGLGARTAERARRPDALSLLSAAFALECVVDPGGLDSLSLALSYAATLGLILGTGPLSALLRGTPRPAPLGEGPAARLGRVLCARLWSALASGLAASLSAVVATLPFVWSTFGELTPWGGLLTLAAVPPVAVLSVLAWIGALWPIGALRVPAEAVARALYAVLELGDRLPWTPVALPPRPLAGLALASGLAFLALRRRGARAPAALLAGVLLVSWSAAPLGLELHALDVGHGLGLVLRAPGLPGLVFDGGSRDRGAVGSEALQPLLAAWEVARPVVVLSHPDLDHASGLERLRTRFPVTWLGAEPAHTDVRGAHGPGVVSAARIDLAAGSARWTRPGTGLELTLLRGSAQPGNEGSRALEVRWQGQRLLFLGDAEEAGLTGLALEPGPLRLLLAPHHGSDAPGLWPWIERCPPEEVWVSASRRPAIAAELDRRGLPWHCTGAEGPLALRLPGVPRTPSRTAYEEGLSGTPVARRP